MSMHEKTSIVQLEMYGYVVQEHKICIIVSEKTPNIITTVFLICLSNHLIMIVSFFV